MTAAMWISLIVPVLSFLVGHFHWVLPNPAGGGGTVPPLPTGIGHGQIIAYLLQLLASSGLQGTPAVPTPATPQPAGGSDLTPLLLKLLTILEQNLQPTSPAPAPNQTLKAA